VRIFGIDPGSVRTGYGCVESDGRRHHLIVCGAITAPPGDAFPQRLARIHHELAALIASCRPDCIAVENLFHGINPRSALKLGHARGVALLAAVEAGCDIVEYTPAEVKRAIVGYGRADKRQVQGMVKLLLGLDAPPSPHDAADALAIAICHLHSTPPAGLKARRYEGGRVVTAIGQAGRLVEVDRQGGRPVEADRQGGRPVEADLQVRPAKPRSWRQYRPPVG
jgi:crossover junction endodeoxyribonuclease RuvC